MSIPAHFVLWKDGTRVTVKHNDKEFDHVPANASYGTRTGLEHIHSWLNTMKEMYDFDGITSSLDGQTYYLTPDGLLSNEVIK